MSKRSAAPVSYAASLMVEPPQPAPAAPASPLAAARTPVAEPEVVQGRGRRPLEDAADPSVLYLHPTGKKALRLYAVEKGVKVHDLLLEAVEAWAAEKGLVGPWRVPSAGPPRRRRG
ncbi:hypothetical protein [Muricoccus vinaceus]|uniref:Uncharacterized protein n=1 Tax=Muricoccus vinaceus TaxID=424704 RepID=A0ABV6J182_9PROT